MLPRPPALSSKRIGPVMTVPNHTNALVAAMARRDAVSLLRCQYPDRWRVIASQERHPDQWRYWRAMLGPLAARTCRCHGQEHRLAG